MTFEHPEGDQWFRFGASWGPIISWDRDFAYRNGIAAIDGGSAVDVVGRRGDTLFFIEIKDYRLHPRTNPEDPVIQLESKVRNTVAGLLGACRREEYSDRCAPFVDLIRNRAIQIKIIYWCETPRSPRASGPIAAKRSKVFTGIQGRDLQRPFRWLAARVAATSGGEDFRNVVPDLVVLNRAHKRRELLEGTLQELSRRRIEVPAELRARIEACDDLELLQRWRGQASLVASVEGLFVAASRRERR